MIKYGFPFLEINPKLRNTKKSPMKLSTFVLLLTILSLNFLHSYNRHLYDYKHNSMVCLSMDKSIIFAILV